MQSSVQNQRSRQTAVEKRLTTVEATVADLMSAVADLRSRIAAMEGNTEGAEEYSGKVPPKKNRKQSSLKRQIDV
jgi:predicted  nucleic acid-binding Zn-ribbon protein